MTTPPSVPSSTFTSDFVALESPALEQRLADLLDDPMSQETVTATSPQDVAVHVVAARLSDTSVSVYDKAWLVAAAHEGMTLICSDNEAMHPAGAQRDFRESWVAAFSWLAANPDVQAHSVGAATGDFQPGRYDVDVAALFASVNPDSADPVALHPEVLQWLGGCVTMLPTRQHSMLTPRLAPLDATDSAIASVVAQVGEAYRAVQEACGDLVAASPVVTNLAHAITRSLDQDHADPMVSFFLHAIAPLQVAIHRGLSLPGGWDVLPQAADCVPTVVDGDVSRRQVGQLLTASDDNESVMVLVEEWGLTAAALVAAWTFAAVTHQAVTVDPGFDSLTEWGA